METGWLWLLCALVTAGLQLSQGDDKWHDKCTNGTFDFTKVTAQESFDVDKILGLWYQTRWYLPQKADVSAEMWDFSVRLFKRDGIDNKFFCKMNHRMKGAKYCADEIEDTLSWVKDGVYFMNEEDKFRENMTITYVYVDTYSFMLEILCHTPENGRCQDYSVTFMSRTKRPRRQDTAKGVMILEKHCYPYMKRFIDSKQVLDCAPSEMNKCPHAKKDKRGREMKDDDDDYNDGWGRGRMGGGEYDDCDNGRRNDDYDGQGRGRMRGKRCDDDDDMMYGRRRRYPHHKRCW